MMKMTEFNNVKYGEYCLNQDGPTRGPRAARQIYADRQAFRNTFSAARYPNGSIEEIFINVFAYNCFIKLGGFAPGPSYLLFKNLYRHY